MEINDIQQPIFGKWNIEEKIGSGAFGTVYKIKCVEGASTQYSALKVIRIPQDAGEIKSLRNELGDDKSVSDYYANFVQDFAKEIEVMAALKGNSNVVSYEEHAFIQNDDGIGWTIYIRMELLTPFVDYQVNKQLSVDDIIKLGIDICSALESCECKNIIHRDIKPENIFISADGNYKLGDFGIARELEKTTGGLSKKGTYSYMAPEVYLGKPYNSTVDIYSLGIVMYKLLNHNRAPFMPEYPNPIRFSDRENALQKRMQGTEVPDIKDIPIELNCIIKMACSFDSKKRYQSATDFKRVLIRCLGLTTPKNKYFIIKNTIVPKPRAEIVQLLADMQENKKQLNSKPIPVSNSQNAGKSEPIKQVSAFNESNKVIDNAKSPLSSYSQSDSKSVKQQPIIQKESVSDTPSEFDEITTGPFSVNKNINNLSKQSQVKQNNASGNIGLPDKKEPVATKNSSEKVNENFDELTISPFSSANNIGKTDIKKEDSINNKHNKNDDNAKINKFIKIICLIIDALILLFGIAFSICMIAFVSFFSFDAIICVSLSAASLLIGIITLLIKKPPKFLLIIFLIIDFGLLIFSSYYYIRCLINLIDYFLY